MKHLSMVLLGCIILAACNNEGATNQATKDSATSNSDTSTHNSHNSSPENTTNNNVTTLNDMDREFVLKTGMGNTAEVEAGKMAQEKSMMDGVKEFGRQMVTDHSDAQAKLKAAVGSNVSVPDSIDKPHSDMKKKLQKLTGSAFDLEYINGQVKDHKETIALFEREIAGGSNTAIKDFAQATLPHLKMHLEKAETLATGKSKKTE